MAEEKKVSEQLQDLYTERFGSDWRKDISLTIRADSLYWFVILIQEAIEQRREKIRAKPQRERDINDIASTGSFECELEMLLEKIKAAIINPSSKKKR